MRHCSRRIHLHGLQIDRWKHEVVRFEWPSVDVLFEMDQPAVNVPRSIHEGFLLVLDWVELINIAWQKLSVFDQNLASTATYGSASRQDPWMYGPFEPAGVSLHSSGGHHSPSSACPECNHLRAGRDSRGIYQTVSDWAVTYRATYLVHKMNALELIARKHFVVWITSRLLASLVAQVSAIGDRCSAYLKKVFISSYVTGVAWSTVSSTRPRFRIDAAIWSTVPLSTGFPFQRFSAAHQVHVPLSSGVLQKVRRCR